MKNGHLRYIRIDEPTSDAELAARRAEGRGREKLWVLYNAQAAIGGLAAIEVARKRRSCRLRPVEPHHKLAAARFRHYWERAGHGLRAAASDGVRVDRSHVAHDAGMAAHLDRRARHFAAVAALGPRAGLVEDCVCREISLTVMARTRIAGFATMGKRQRQAGTARLGDEILDGLDVLATHWGMRTR